MAGSSDIPVPGFRRKPSSAEIAAPPGMGARSSAVPATSSSAPAPHAHPHAPAAPASNATPRTAPVAVAEGPAPAAVPAPAPAAARAEAPAQAPARAQAPAPAAAPAARPAAAKPAAGTPAAKTPAAKAGPAGGAVSEAAAAPSASPPKAKHKWLPGGFLSRILFLASIPPVILCAVGVQYYVLPLEERAWSPLDEWYSPSGYIGQSLGFLAFGLFLFLWLFPIRKRAKWLAFSGSVPRWLDVHIVAGLLIPFIGAMHAAWRFNGLIGLGYFSMFIVSVSGVIGRYLYTHIPRKRSGLELNREEAAAERRALIGKLVERTGIPLERVIDLLTVSQKPSRKLGVLATFRALIQDDVERRKAARHLVAEWKAALPEGEKPDRRTLREMRRAARREMALQQQIRVLDATHRVFRLWHVAHLPFAIVAFLAVLLHVAVVIAFGATWIM